MKYGPRITTSGLILCLDAADKNSYPGSGVMWYDLCRNGINGTLINGPTFNTSNEGVIALSGASQYIDIPLNLASTSHTIIGASRYVVVGGRTFSSKNNNWLMGHWSTTTENYYSNGAIVGLGTGASDTNWRIYAATRDIIGPVHDFYINGVRGNVTAPAGGSAGPNGFAIGSWAGTSEFSNSQIGFMSCYNRILTLAEIRQNFNALRIRYGL